MEKKLDKIAQELNKMNFNIEKIIKQMIESNKKLVCSSCEKQMCYCLTPLKVVDIEKTPQIGSQGPVNENCGCNNNCKCKHSNK
jgi:hypothetical protein